MTYCAVNSASRHVLFRYSLPSKSAQVQIPPRWPPQAPFISPSTPFSHDHLCPETGPCCVRHCFCLLSLCLFIDPNWFHAVDRPQLPRNAYSVIEYVVVVVD